MENALDMVAQIGIAVLGVSSILLLAKKNKWGFVCGLLAQPFWFLTAFLNKQFGVLLLSVVYSLSFAYGVYEWFYKKDAKPLGRKQKVKK